VTSGHEHVSGTSRHEHVSGPLPTVAKSTRIERQRSQLFPRARMHPPVQEDQSQLGASIAIISRPTPAPTDATKTTLQTKSRQFPIGASHLEIRRALSSIGDGKPDIGDKSHVWS
jgi:hypothetical protein